MNSDYFAKTVVLSSFFTLIVVLGTVYAFRLPLVKYITSHTVPTITANLNKEVVLTDEEKIVSTIEVVNSAVVSVIITKEVPVYEKYYESFIPWGIWGEFAIPRVREKGTEEREVGGGSGFIVSNDGIIVTNKHVVEDVNASYSVLLNNGLIYNTEVLARDPQLDIAILKISEPLKESLTFLKFGDSKSLRKGQTVIAIGNALAEFSNSVSVGVVSGLSRSIVASDGYGHTEQLDQVIQTDAAINPGNSGGPLLNIHGEVVGVNVATSIGADNIGFALPADIVKTVVESVREHGEIMRPFLGVRYTMINDRIAKQNNLPVNYGALIIRGETNEEIAVIPDSPADKAGIEENSIILSIDGESLQGFDLATVLRNKKVGEEIELKILQDGVEKLISLVLMEAV